VHPEQRERIIFTSAAEIRQDIADAMPNYAGIEHLSKKGDQVQYGGRYLYAGGVFETADQKGHFSAVTPPEIDLPEGKFILSTRRGKQFNSLIYGAKDPVTGAARSALLISAEDAGKLGISNGSRVVARSDNGASMEFQIRIDQVQPHTVQAFWPECNVLIRRRVCDVAAGVPDYNAIVELAPVDVVAGAAPVAALRAP
jgi:anaerobic selenocysteine-containing dehydrogenase